MSERNRLFQFLGSKSRLEDPFPKTDVFASCENLHGGVYGPITDELVDQAKVIVAQCNNSGGCDGCTLSALANQKPRH